MLKITPYLGTLVLIVSIGGLWYPKLGYVVALVFLSILVISPFRGRWFCGNLCLWGSFNDFWVGKISRKVSIPGLLSSLFLRVPVFILLMGFNISRIISTEGAVDKLGMVFVTMSILTASFSILFGAAWSPRAWCTVCPMGTLQRFLGRGRYPLKLDPDLCTDCSRCQKVCPMQLDVRAAGGDPDCIKCGRCVEACPRGALRF
jgi:ferredoxin-type protein NapH